MDLFELLKLKAEHWFTGLLMTLATFAPGSLILFLYQRELFVSLDLGKIILLSLGLTLPLIFTNLLLSLPHAIDNSKLNLKSLSPDIVEPKQHLMSACLFTCVPLYLALTLSYWLKFSFPRFCLCVVGLNVLVAAISWIGLFRNSGGHK